MKTMILTALTATTLALAGCAVGSPSPEPESQDLTDQAAVTGDRASQAFAHEDVGIGGRGGVAVADGPQRQMHDLETATAMGDRAHPVLAGESDTQGIGGRGGVTVAGDYEKRMYDVDGLPRISQRSPYEAKLTVLVNASVIPHGGTLEGSEIRRGQDSDLGVGGPK